MPARELCTIDEEHVFLVAVAGGSPLLKVQSISKKLPSNLQPPKKRARTLKQLEALPTAEQSGNVDKTEVSGADGKENSNSDKEEAFSLPPVPADSKELQGLLDLHASMR